MRRGEEILRLLEAEKMFPNDPESARKYAMEDDVLAFEPSNNSEFYLGEIKPKKQQKLINGMKPLDWTLLKIELEKANKEF